MEQEPKIENKLEKDRVMLELSDSISDPIRSVRLLFSPCHLGGKR